ncbi:MAG: hypothetical protein C4519_00590 [Desulfobacteraceae bacterium]|nr:MAG: hypothetical protein C4519_00590 [Desulfobacteraceae bacterium]
MTRAIRKTARRLGNTLASCRKYYVHPWVVESYLSGELSGLWKEAERLGNDGMDGLSQAEKTVMLLLQKGSTETHPVQ